MAGFVAILGNRVLTSTVSLKVGTAVTSYPAANLNSPLAWCQSRVTASASAVRYMFRMPAAPSSTSNTEWQIDAIGIVNHNLDGATIEVRSHTSDNYAAATQRLAGTALDASMGNPNLLIQFTANRTAAEYWYLDITSAPSTVQIGVVSLGYSMDFGTPMRATQIKPAPTVRPLRTSTGLAMITRLSDPIITKRYVFEDPTGSGLAKTSIYDKGVTAATTFPTYSTLYRQISKARQIPINTNGAYASAVLTAGGAVPCAYHEGSDNGLSGGGRPAFYGHLMFSIERNKERTVSPLVLDVEDCLDANNLDIQPPTN